MKTMIIPKMAVITSEKELRVMALMTFLKTT